MVFDWYSNLSEHLDLVMHQFSMSPDIWENTWRYTPRGHLFANAPILRKGNVFTPSHPPSNLRTVDCLVSSASHHVFHSHRQSQSVCFHQLPVRFSAFLLGLQLRLLKLDVSGLGWECQDEIPGIHMGCRRASVTIAQKVTDASISCLL